MLPVVVAHASATLVVCRRDQQRTTDHLRPFPALAETAWGRRKEERQQTASFSMEEFLEVEATTALKVVARSLLLLEPARPVRASRRFASCCFHSSRQNWSRSSQRTGACLQRDKEESLLL